MAKERHTAAGIPRSNACIPVGASYGNMVCACQEMDDSSGARFCAQAAALALFFLDFGRAVYIAGDGASCAWACSHAPQPMQPHAQEAASCTLVQPLQATTAVL